MAFDEMRNMMDNLDRQHDELRRWREVGWELLKRFTGRTNHALYSDHEMRRMILDACIVPMRRYSDQRGRFMDNVRR